MTTIQRVDVRYVTRTPPSRSRYIVGDWRLRLGQVYRQDFVIESWFIATHADQRMMRLPLPMYTWTAYSLGSVGSIWAVSRNLLEYPLGSMLDGLSIMSPELRLTTLRVLATVDLADVPTILQNVFTAALDETERLRSDGART